MNKQSFTIPEGCKAVTVEQVGNQIITTFEPDFKRGDVLIAKGEQYDYLVIFECINEFDCDNKMEFYVMLSGFQKFFFNDICNHEGFRHATPEEAQRLFDALAKEGKRWNPETMQVEPINKERWRAKNEGIYYSVDISTTRLVYYLEECGDAVDNRNYNSGNYFQTEEQAQRAAARLKAELDKFWEEELR